MVQSVTTFLSSRTDDDFTEEVHDSLDALGAEGVSLAQVNNGTVIVANGPIGLTLAVEDSWLDMRHIPLSYAEKLLTVRGKGSKAEEALGNLYAWLTAITLGTDDDIERTPLSMNGVTVETKPSIVDVAAERNRREEWKRGRIRL